jgi:hypothetical protein
MSIWAFGLQKSKPPRFRRSLFEIAFLQFQKSSNNGSIANAFLLHVKIT